MDMKGIHLIKLVLLKFLVFLSRTGYCWWTKYLELVVLIFDGVAWGGNSRLELQYPSQLKNKISKMKCGSQRLYFAFHMNWFYNSAQVEWISYELDLNHLGI